MECKREWEGVGWGKQGKRVRTAVWQLPLLLVVFSPLLVFLVPAAAFLLPFSSSEPLPKSSAALAAASAPPGPQLAQLEQLPTGLESLQAWRCFVGQGLPQLFRSEKQETQVR